MNAATLRPFCPVSPFCPWAKGYFLLDINITACQTQGEYKSKMRTVCLTAFSKDSDSNSGTSHNFGQDLNCGSGSATELLSATSSATAKPFIFQRLTSRVADLRINLLFLPVADDSGYSNGNSRNADRFARQIGKLICHGFRLCDFPIIHAVCHAVTDPRAQCF